MSTIKTNMGLTVWDLATDTFNYTQLADNFIAIDQHDHSNGKGAPIDGGAITVNSLDGSKIIDGSLDGNAKLKPGSVTRTRIRSGIAPEVVTTLPSKNGLDSGYEIYYRTTNVVNQSMATALWHLRYDGSSKWEFVGGTPVSDYMAGIFYVTNRSTGTGVYGSYTPDYDQVKITGTPNNNLSVTVPPGYYHVTATARGSATYVGSLSAGAIMLMTVGSSKPTNDNRSVGFAPPITTVAQTNLATTMTVANDVTTTSSSTEISVWVDAYNVTVGSADPASNITIGSITATPIYLNA